MSANRCGLCRHWHKMPDQSGLLIGTKQNGQCREGPPAVAMAVNNGQIQQLCSYPLLNEDFIACSRFKERTE